MSVSNFVMMHAPCGLHTAIVHDGIPPVQFFSRTEARARIADATQIPPDAFIIGTIAELHRNKGIDTLIRAAVHGPDVHYVIIGGGEDEMKLRNLVQLLNLSKTVHIVGFIDEAARHLKAFDVFVLPSRTEALGYVILEAGMAELPVVATTVGGIPEVIDDQLTGILVPSDDTRALASAITELYANPNTRTRYAENLHTTVLKNFSLKDMIEKTVVVYEQ